MFGRRSQTLPRQQQAFEKGAQKPLWSYKTDSAVKGVAVSRGGEYVAVASDKVYFLKKSGELLWSYKTGSTVNGVAVSPDGEYVAAGSNDKKVYLLKNGGKLLWKFGIGHYVYGVAVSRDGEYVAAGSHDKNLHFLRKSGELLWSHETGDYVLGVAVSQDGEYVAAASKDTKVYLLRKNGERLWSYGTSDSANTVSVSQGGGYVAAGAQDNKIYFIDNGEGLLWSYEIGSPVNGVAVSPDGEYVVSGSNDRMVYLFKTGVSDTGMKEALPALKPSVTPSLPGVFPPELAYRYDDVAFLGKGGFARVFKAKRRQDGVQVAVKIPLSLDEETGKTFLKEIENWTKLDHKNIVKVYDYNIMPIPFFEMELCDGDLTSLKKPMEIEVAVTIMLSICEGLEYAHSLKIIHRDLKPQNIMLKRGVPKITDWGLSKVVSESASTYSSTTSLTPNYAAPEQISARFGNRDERTDIWQFGVVLYELVTGELPFKGRDFTETAVAITSEHPTTPSNLVPQARDIEPFIMKCLEKLQDKRYKSITEIERDLSGYLALKREESGRTLTVRRT